MQALNFSSVNVALLKPTTSFSIYNNNAGLNGPARAVDGVVSESSYYNSHGTSAAEFWQVDLGTPTLIASITFYNRAPMSSACWTPPAAWTAAGIAGSCDTRAINQTLRLLDGAGVSRAAYNLTANATQSFLMTQC